MKIFHRDLKEYSEPPRTQETNPSTRELLCEKVAKWIVHDFRIYFKDRDVRTKIEKQIIKEQIASGNKEYEEYERLLNVEHSPGWLHMIVYHQNEERFMELKEEDYLRWAGSFDPDAVELAREKLFDD